MPVTRSYRLAAVSAAALFLVAGGTVLATRAPRATGSPAPLAVSAAPEASEAAEAPPSADEVAHAVDRLHASGIDASAGVVTDLAAKYGLGGAVRVLAWVRESGKTADEIAALRDAGKGWGQIAHQLGVQPGIGSIMGNGDGHGRDTAPGQQKQDEEPAAP